MCRTAGSWGSRLALSGLYHWKWGSCEMCSQFGPVRFRMSVFVCSLSNITVSEWLPACLGQHCQFYINTFYSWQPWEYLGKLVLVVWNFSVKWLYPWQPSKAHLWRQCYPAKSSVFMRPGQPLAKSSTDSMIEPQRENLFPSTTYLLKLFGVIGWCGGCHSKHSIWVKGYNFCAICFNHLS